MRKHELARLLVIIEDADRQPVTDAEVELREAATNTPHEIELLDAPGQAYGEDLTPGTYELRVSSSQSDLQPETRMLELAAGYNSATVILGKEGQPFFYAGETKVYFEPDRNSFLVVARGDRAAEVAPDLLRNQDLEVRPLPCILTTGHSGYEASSEQPSDSSFVSVDLPGGQTADQAGELMESVANELRRQQGLRVILALPVQRGAGPVQGLTNELTVRFDDSVKQDEVERIAGQLGLTVERPILYAGNAFLLSRPGPPSYDLLRIARVLQQEFPVLYAEPNLLQQLEIDQFTPNDFLWANLTHLPLINCDDAWQTLGNINANVRGGSSDITIAVFDPDGVAPDHPDLTANLTDGTSKLVTSFNFNAMAPQTVAGLAGDHGTQCASTATAAFNNNQGIVGVAPNCHLIGARLPSPATGIAMADAFMWSAGFNTGSTNPNFPALPARSADVISNSWGVTGAVLSSAMRNCFDRLTVNGRGGRGCVVTFSVGNLGHVQFSNQRTFAAYERNIAVGASINVNPTSPVNSFHPDPNGNTNNINVAVDTRALYSPFGPEMDAVAPSHTAYNAAGGGLIDPTTSAVRVGNGALDGCPGPPICNDYAAGFGGTSHASPTIAGVAALVLSVNPALSLVEVREILRTTTVRIDFANTNPIGQWVDNDGDGVREFSQWYGYGRVDANAAVTATRDRTLGADIVGFGDGGVWISLSNGNGTFQGLQLPVANFGYNAGGWRVDRHPRFLADLTGDGRADIVGFGDGGVWVSLNNGDGTFQALQLAVANFGYSAGAGGWRVDRHPRFLADLTGDGRDDIVGFGDGGVWISLSNGDGTFQALQLAVANFGYNAGGWRVDRHPRFLADIWF